MARANEAIAHSAIPITTALTDN